MNETLPNIRGEVFHVGDIVAVYPDVPQAAKDRGEITEIGEYGAYNVTVRWEGETADSAHVDRIALVTPGIFS